MNMIEKVARALYKECFKDRSQVLTPNWEDIGSIYQNSWMEAAKATIGAMREPTEEMVDAGGLIEAHKDCIFIHDDKATEVFQIMIDAALKE